MDEATVRAKMTEEIDRVRRSSLAVAFGWTLDVDGLDAFVVMSPRRQRDRIFLLKMNFDDFPRQAPSCIFVDVETRSPSAEAWPPKVKHEQQPDGICIAGTRECHAHYHENDSACAWDPAKWPLLPTLTEIHRFMEKGLGLLH